LILEPPVVRNLFRAALFVFCLGILIRNCCDYRPQGRRIITILSRIYQLRHTELLRLAVDSEIGGRNSSFVGV
jgi:hypothetical protein